MGAGETAAKFGFRLGLFFWLGQILVIVSAWRFLPPKLPLFYSRPWGEEQLTTPIGLFLLPLLSLAVLVLNLILTSFSSKENLPRQILMSAVAVVNLLNLITLIQIVRLVI